jgi:hypothetical protein
MSEIVRPITPATAARRITAVALAAGLLLVMPATRAAAFGDLRSPDAREAAAAVDRSPSHATDLRTPDARDVASTVARATSQPKDLRSPDARDAASSTTGTGPYVDAISSLSREALAATPPTLSSTGTDWGDVGIGAASVSALLLIGLGGMLLLTRHRDAVRRSRAPIASS